MCRYGQKFFLIALAVALVVGAERANALTWDFAGAWTGTPVSGNFSGSFSYDPATPAGPTGPSGTLYAPATLTLDVFSNGATTLDLGNLAVVGVDNDNTVIVPGDLVDVVQVAGFFGPGAHPVDVLDTAFGLSGAMGSEVLSVVLTLADLDGTVINSNALPLAYDLVDFESALLSVRYSTGLQALDFEEQFGSLTSLTLREEPAVVPLPAAFPLFAGGLGLFGLLGWRRKRMATAAA